jgi:hypothetical protein
MHKRQGGVVIFACIDPRCGKLIANALNRKFIRHKRVSVLALRILPIFDMMAVSSLVVKPGFAISDSSPASSDGGSVALVIPHALKKFCGRKL